MDVFISTSDSKVLQHGFNMGDPPDGMTVAALTDEQETAYEAALTESGGSGVTFDGATFTALPAPPPFVPTNPYQGLIDALSQIPSSDPGHNVAQITMNVLSQI